MEKDRKIKIDATLFDLCLGIFLYGVVCQIVVLFFSRKPEYSIGLWIGVFLAIAGSVHMWWTIDRSHHKHNNQYADMRCRDPDRLPKELIGKYTVYHKVNIRTAGH